jgi:hypothetical protein
MAEQQAAADAADHVVVARVQQRLHALLAAEGAADRLLDVAHADARGVLGGGQHRRLRQPPSPAPLVQCRRARQGVRAHRAGRHAQVPEQDAVGVVAEAGHRFADPPTGNRRIS